MKNKCNKKCTPPTRAQHSTPLLVNELDATKKRPVCVLSVCVCWQHMHPVWTVIGIPKHETSNLNNSKLKTCPLLVGPGCSLRAQSNVVFPLRRYLRDRHRHHVIARSRKNKGVFLCKLIVPVFFPSFSPFSIAALDRCPPVPSRQKLIFQEGSEIFNLWRTPPVDLYIKIYLFNVTNAEDFMAGRAEKMQIEEVGPYVYR